MDAGGQIPKDCSFGLRTAEQLRHLASGNDHVHYLEGALRYTNRGDSTWRAHSQGIGSQDEILIAEEAQKGLSG